MQLFDEYVASFARGERPDLRDYLARAGDQREELAKLVDIWLQPTSSRPTPTRNRSP